MSEMVGIYKNWELFEVIPKGWRVDKTAGSPLFGYEFINNGKSILNGGRRALLKIQRPFIKPETPLQKKFEFKINNPCEKQPIDDNYRKTLNDLARQTFKLKLLQDIRADLIICDIEGWNKKEYIHEIKKLVTSIGETA